MKKLNKIINKYHYRGGRNIIYNVPFDVLDEVKRRDKVIVAHSPNHIRQIRNGRLNDYIILAPMGMNIAKECSTHKVSEYK
mgnify:FL=1